MGASAPDPARALSNRERQVLVQPQVCPRSPGRGKSCGRGVSTNTVRDQHWKRSSGARYIVHVHMIAKTRGPGWTCIQLRPTSARRSLGPWNWLRRFGLRGQGCGARPDEGGPADPWSWQRVCKRAQQHHAHCSSGQLRCGADSHGGATAMGRRARGRCELGLGRWCRKIRQSWR